MQNTLKNNISAENISKDHSYLDIARDISIFCNDELKILEGVLDDYWERRDGYMLFEERRDIVLLGFVIFGRIPITAFGWDIYWLVVNKLYQGRGIGRGLLERVEQYIGHQQHKAYIRVETSTRMEYCQARNLYAKMSYSQIARVRNFYGQGDDSIIFYKEINQEY